MGIVLPLYDSGNYVLCRTYVDVHKSKRKSEIESVYARCCSASPLDVTGARCIVTSYWCFSFSFLFFSIFFLYSRPYRDALNCPTSDFGNLCCSPIILLFLFLSPQKLPSPKSLLFHLLQLCLLEIRRFATLSAWTSLSRSPVTPP